MPLATVTTSRWITLEWWLETDLVPSSVMPVGLEQYKGTPEKVTTQLDLRKPSFVASVATSHEFVIKSDDVNGERPRQESPTDAPRPNRNDCNNL